MTTRFENLEFDCPHCGKTHNVRVFLERNLEEERTKLDTEFTEEVFFEDGRVRISFPHCECECGQQFLLDFENGYCIIYDDANGIVAEEGYSTA